jgi:pimeloyl-ACP methyl ester carboxylesterase
LLTGAIATAQPANPTIVLVHGAFADSSSWYGVITILEKDGYSVIAAANPLRSVKGDADTVRALLVGINTPVVLGHSYGGMVISNAANGQPNVKALVYVAVRQTPEKAPATSIVSFQAAWSAQHLPRQWRFPVAGTISMCSRKNSTMPSQRTCLRMPRG